jgi:hypothetical protein
MIKHIMLCRFSLQIAIYIFFEQKNIILHLNRFLAIFIIHSMIHDTFDVVDRTEQLLLHADFTLPS